MNFIHPPRAAALIFEADYINTCDLSFPLLDTIQSFLHLNNTSILVIAGTFK